MSRESEQDEHWLGGYRRVVVFILLAVIVTALVMSYRSHREEALAISASLNAPIPETTFGVFRM